MNINNNKPIAFGKAHSTLQQYDSEATSIQSLFNLLDDKNPLKNWNHDPSLSSVSVENVHSWFPNDAQPVFSMSIDGEITTLSYQELQGQVLQAPSFSGNVAIL